MRHADWIQLVAVSYFVALAFLRSLPPRRRLGIALLAASSILVTLTLRFSSHVIPHRVSSVLRDWIPGALILIPFYQVGLFFVGPDERLQNRLASIDRRILLGLGPGVRALAQSSWLRTYLELAYLLVYPLIPLGVGCLYLTHRRSSIDDFWSVVLTSTFICYAVTPFAPALPPRTVGTMLFPPSPSRLRMLNVWLLRRTSIQVVTFPSGHVACAMAIALSLLRLEPWIGLAFLVLALTIAVATVVGGYHYISDAVFALLISLFTFLLSLVF